MANISLSIDGKFYQGTAGTAATTEVDTVADVTLNMEVQESDASNRAGGGYTSAEVTLRTATLEWEMPYDLADTNMVAFENAFIAGTKLALKCLDRSDGRGIDADFVLTAANRSEALAEHEKISFTAKTNTYLRAPSFTTGTGS